MPAKPKSFSKDSSANLGFEAKLWLAAEKLHWETFRRDLSIPFLTPTHFQIAS